MKILLVDDDVFLRDMYATKFSEHGDTVATASDGEEALRKVEEDSYDVVIMDMVMPGMTGLDLLRALKNAHPDAASKYIILSNQGEDTDIQKAQKEGVSGYIIKADSIPSEVVEKVHTLVS
jgi:two-component system chemotaxis response regulator CheY